MREGKIDNYQRAGFSPCFRASASQQTAFWTRGLDQRKSSHRIALHIEGKQVPVVVHTGQVIRPHLPPVRLVGAQVPVEEPQFPPLFQSPRDDLEILKVCILRRKRAEGEHFIQVAQGDQWRGEGKPGSLEGSCQRRASPARRPPRCACDGCRGDRRACRARW